MKRFCIFTGSLSIVCLALSIFVATLFAQQISTVSLVLDSAHYSPGAVSSWSGHGAFAKAVAAAPTGAAIYTIALNSGGTGYVAGDTITVTQGGGSGGEAQVLTVSSGVVTSLQLVYGHQGLGYATASALTTTGGHGSGLTVNIVAIQPTATINIPAGYTDTISSNLTTPPINLNFVGSGMLSVANGFTLTLNGSINADLTQHFDLSAGGSVNLAGANVTALYPQWLGATCGGADNTSAIQNTLNLSSSAAYVAFTCRFVTGNLYIPSWNGGIKIEGEGAAVLGGASNPTSGLIAKTGTTGALLSVYSENSTIRDLLLDCNSQCANPLLLVEAQSTVLDNPLATNGTGSGIVLWNEGSPTTTATSAITGGSTTSFTVANAALPGYPLSGTGNVGGNHCGTLVITGGGNTESQTFSVSGNTITLSGTLTHNYSIGATVQCHGNDNSISMFAPTSKSNGGAGIDFVEGSDINSVGMFNPNMFGNGGFGILGAGSTSIVSGGTFEGNAGVIQLGDASGRQTVGWDITAGDTESGTGSVVSACDLWSTVHFRANIQGLTYATTGCANQSTLGVGYTLLQPGNTQEYTIKSINGISYLQPGLAGWKTFNSIGAVTFTNTSAVIALTAHGLSANQPVIFYTNGALPNNFDNNQIYFVSPTGLTSNQFEVATTAGGSPIVAGSAGSGTSRVGTIVASPLYNSTGSTTGITTTNIPPNRVFEDGGSANNALAVTLADAVTGVAIPINATNQGIKIVIPLSHSLASGTGNTIALNGGSALTISNNCTPGSFSIGKSVTANSVITLDFSNSNGFWQMEGNCP